MFSGVCSLYFVRILTSLVSQNRFGPPIPSVQVILMLRTSRLKPCSVEGVKIEVSHKIELFITTCRLPARKHSQEVQQKGNQTTKVLLSFACGPAQEKKIQICGRVETTFGQISSSQRAQHAAPSSGLTGTQQQDYYDQKRKKIAKVFQKKRTQGFQLLGTPPPPLSGREFHSYSLKTRLTAAIKSPRRDMSSQGMKRSSMTS